MLIPTPEGYVIPEGIAIGDTFEELVTFRYDEEGLTPVSIAGVAVAEEAPPEEVVEDALAEEESLGMMGIGDSIMAGL